ncbi:GtrA family protein [Pelomonas sp. Root1237]|uniref:GtrA family protein n=1 Tax=Pelomonas sp. Root1237 TaxID=1736434 RepID=UPI0006FAE83B|nr:GtrA family protein [Pelomonas sp. Root1237]KQV96286.1 hypothetical protein ASC91_01650 [Pelomonas sp. Root1237]
MTELRLHPKLGRHAVVGAGCALLSIGLVHIGTAVLHWQYLAAAWLTCFTTIPISYFLHRRYTFSVANRAGWAEFGRFLGQQFLQFCAGLVLLAIGVEWLDLNPTLAMVAATAVLWLFSFLVQSRWVFRAELQARR